MEFSAVRRIRPCVLPGRRTGCHPARRPSFPPIGPPSLCPRIPGTSPLAVRPPSHTQRAGQLHASRMAFPGLIHIRSSTQGDTGFLVAPRGRYLRTLGEDRGLYRRGQSGLIYPGGQGNLHWPRAWPLECDSRLEACRGFSKHAFLLFELNDLAQRRSRHL